MREIHWDAPLSEDDKAWLRDRDKHSEIEANEARFAENLLLNPKLKIEDEDEDEDSGETQDDYDSWKVQELKDEAVKRDPPVDLTGLSKKEQLIEALRAWDREHPDDEGE